MYRGSPTVATVPDDDELLVAHRDGDPSAFGELAGRHEAGLWAVAVRTLRNHEDAADAVQETLVAAYRRAGSHRGDSSVRTWLYRILVNACIDRIRREGRRPTVPLLDAEPGRGPGDLAADAATRLDLVSALAELPAEQRVAVIMVDVQGWPVTEVAVMLGVPVGTVKSRCGRGRAKLAVLVGHLREGRG